MNTDDTKNENTLEVRDILEQLFDFSGYTEEEKEQLLDEASDLILETALLRALEAAGEETQEAFSKLMAENPSPEQLAEFIQTYLPDLEDYVAEEVQNFINIGNKTQEEGGEGEESVPEGKQAFDPEA